MQTKLVGFVALILVVGFLAGVLLLRPLATSPASVSAAETPTPPTITVWGDSEVKVTPDIVRLTMGVQTRAATAQEAQQENARLMSAVLSSLEELGVPEKSIQTSYINLWPMYDYEANKVVGYVADHNVVVTLEEMEKSGQVLDAAVAAGANVVGQISFGVKDDTAARLQAYEQAVKAARAKADAIAKGLGVTITGAASVVEQYGGGPVVYREVMVEKQAASGYQTPVMPGELTITAQVNVVFTY